MSNNGTAPEGAKSRNGWRHDAVPEVDIKPRVVSEEPEAVAAPTSPFPLRCLPPVAEDMARNICSAVGVPESLAGPAVLGILSGAIGAGLEVQSGPARTSRANLYTIVSGMSGSGKSESMRLAAAPLRACEQEDIDEFRKDTLPRAEAEIDTLNVEIAKLKKLAGKDLTMEGRAELQDDLRDRKAALAATEALMQPPVLTVEDTTQEKLAVNLSCRGETLFSASSDAGSIINNLLGRYTKGERTDESLYLKAWTGESCKVDRMGRASIWLTRPCLSALWFVQPDKVDSLLAAESLTDGGFIQRLLLCHSGCEMTELDAEGKTVGTEAISHEATTAWNALVRELLLCFRKSQCIAPIVRPSQEAKTLFINHYNAVVRRCRAGELRDVQSFAARWTEQAWRIGLCLHAGLNGQVAASVDLNADTARCAIDLADWFSNQQLAILASIRSDRKRVRLNRLRALIVEYGGEATLRDLSLRNHFKDEEVRGLATEYPTLLAIAKRGTKGRPTEVAYLPDQPHRASEKHETSHPPASKASKATKAPSKK